MNSIESYFCFRIRNVPCSVGSPPPPLNISIRQGCYLCAGFYCPPPHPLRQKKKRKRSKKGVNVYHIYCLVFQNLQTYLEWMEGQDMLIIDWLQFLIKTRLCWYAAGPIDVQYSQTCPPFTRVVRMQNQINTYLYLRQVKCR